MLPPAAGGRRLKVFLTTMPSCSPPTCLGEPCWQLHRWQMGLALGCSYRAAVVPQSLPVPSKAGERHILERDTSWMSRTELLTTDTSIKDSIKDSRVAITAANTAPLT